MGSKASHTHTKSGQLRSVKHSGFKGAQAQIADRLESQGVPAGEAEDRAGAILAAGARNASPAAKQANPRLKRVY